MRISFPVSCVLLLMLLFMQQPHCRSMLTAQLQCFNTQSSQARLFYTQKYIYPLTPSWEESKRWLKSPTAAFYKTLRNCDWLDCRLSANHSLLVLGMGDFINNDNKECKTCNMSCIKTLVSMMGKGKCNINKILRN